MPQRGVRSPVWDRSTKMYDGFEKRWHYYEAVAEGVLRELGAGRGGSRAKA